MSNHRPRSATSCVPSSWPRCNRPRGLAASPRARRCRQRRWRHGQVVDARPPASALNMALGIAASIAIVAALTVVLVNRRSEPNGVDTSQDPAIAKSALFRLTSSDRVGTSPINSIAFVTSVADVAASVPDCAPYVDYAFDRPRRVAVTTGRIFTGPPLFNLTQWVYIFPTEAAATAAMDKIAEPAFVPCFERFMDALFPQDVGGIHHDQDHDRGSSARCPWTEAGGSRSVDRRDGRGVHCHGDERLRAGRAGNRVRQSDTRRRMTVLTQPAGWKKVLILLLTDDLENCPRFEPG